MDTRRLLMTAAAGLSVAGCGHAPERIRALLTSAETPAPGPDPAPPMPSPQPLAGRIETSEPVPPPPLTPPPPPPLAATTVTPETPPPPKRPAAEGRRAIAAANADSRIASSSDAFIGGVQVFSWRPGRVYEVWAAPLRVTTLTLGPGETVTAKAAGDTVRWQIGESLSGEGGHSRTHVLIKPLQAGLETNLVLTTNRRVYMLQLRSGAADAFNAAVAWDLGAVELPPPPPGPEAAPAVPVEMVTPAGPIDARYRISAGRRPPRWTPTSVFNDGVRTFIVLPPDASTVETPALFVLDGAQAQLTNYRQAPGLIIVDRLFDAAELRLGDRRPQVVRLSRAGDRP